MAQERTGVVIGLVAATIVAAVSVMSCSTETGVAFKPKHPTHKVVCACECAASGGPTPIDEETSQTFDPPLGGCSTLNETSCETSAGRKGKLKDCTKTTVPTALVVGAEALEIAQ